MESAAVLENIVSNGKH